MEHLLRAGGWVGRAGSRVTSVCVHSRPAKFWAPAVCMRRVPPVLMDVTARHLRGPTQDCALQTTRCRLTEARAGLRGSVLPSKGASACEDCNRATCLHLRRERQRDGETDRQRCRGTEHWTRQQSFLLVEAQVLAEHLRLWDRKFSSTNKQRPLYLESFGGPALRLGPGSPIAVLGLSF